MKKIRKLLSFFGIVFFCYFALTLSLSFAYVENIRIGFDPDLVPERIVLIEKDENIDKWKIKNITSEDQIKRENENQEALAINILREQNALYVQPFFEKNDNWKSSGGVYSGDDVYFHCKVKSGDKSKFTPCNSNLTSFVKTEFFFIAGTTTYRLSKNKIINALKEAQIIQKLIEIETESIKPIDNKKFNLTTHEKLSANQETLAVPIPEYDGIYILTTDNLLIAVPEATYERLTAYDEIPSRDKWLYGGAVKISISFKTDQYHHISINRFRALIIKGFELNNIELRICKRQLKLFSTEFSNNFKFFPDERFSLTDFKRKTIDKSVFLLEPASKRVLGDINSGLYLLISYKSKDVPWSAFINQQKGILGFESDKPIFWLIGIH